MMPGRVRRRDDRGATLVLVLIIVTVVGVVMGAVLLYADTNLRTTIALRDQTGGTYGTDAAGNAALAELKNHPDSCTDPSGTTSQLGSGNGANAFYSPTGSGNAVNATIVCTPDQVNGKMTVTVATSGHGVPINSNNVPAYALLAMQHYDSTKESISTTGKVCVLNGDVASNGVLSATDTFGVRNANCSSGSNSGLTIQAYGSGRRGGCSGSRGTFTPTRCTQLLSPIDAPPQAPPPGSAGPVDPARVCFTIDGIRYAAFRPGEYDDVTLLTAPCDGLPANFEWFTPGTYYFTYGGAWQWVGTTLVAGTPTSGPTTLNTDGSPNTPTIPSLDLNDPNTLAGLALTDPDAGCADPAAQNQYPGVEFVFSGSSQVQATEATANICASYSDSSPNSLPTAIYGQGSAATLLDLNGGRVHINGYVHAPAEGATISNNSTGTLFNWGAVLLALDAPNFTASAPLAQVPSANDGFTKTTKTVYSYKYVDVWTCDAASSPCSTSGSPDLRIKVQYKDDGGKVTVLSWSAQP
jgi:Tfp pilus assembly protein PilX